MSTGLQIATLAVAAIAGLGSVLSPMWVTRRNKKAWNRAWQLPVYQEFAATVSEFLQVLVNCAPSMSVDLDDPMKKISLQTTISGPYRNVRSKYTALAGVAVARIGKLAEDLMELVRDAHTETFVQAAATTASTMSHADAIGAALKVFQAEYKNDLKLG